MPRRCRNARSCWSMDKMTSSTEKMCSGAELAYALAPRSADATAPRADPLQMLQHCRYDQDVGGELVYPLWKSTILDFLGLDSSKCTADYARKVAKSCNSNAGELLQQVWCWPPTLQHSDSSVQRHHYEQAQEIQCLCNMKYMHMTWDGATGKANLQRADVWLR